MSNIFEQIKNLYTANSYYEKYGSSVIFTLFIIVIVITLISYFTLQSQMVNLRIQNKNNTLDKCSPFIIPIYGNISNGQPGPGQSKYNKIFEDTADNFNTCTSNILSTLLDVLLQPFYVTLGIIVGNMNSIKSMIKENGNMTKLFERMMHIITSFLMNTLQTIIYGIAEVLNSVVSALVQSGSTMNSMVRWSGAVYEGVIVYGFKRIFYAMNKLIMDIVYIFIGLFVLAIGFFWTGMISVVMVIAILMVLIIVIIIILVSIQVSGGEWADKNDITVNAAAKAPDLQQIFQPGSACPLPGWDTKLEFFGKARYSPTVKYTGDLKDPARNMRQGTWNLGENLSSGKGSWERGIMGASRGALGSIHNWSNKGPIYLNLDNHDIFRPADASIQYGSTIKINNSTTIGKNPYIFGPLHGYKKMVILIGAKKVNDKWQFKFSELIDIQQNDTMIPAAFMDGGVCSKYLKHSNWDICYIEGSGAYPTPGGLVVAQFKNPVSYEDINMGNLELAAAEADGAVRETPTTFSAPPGPHQQCYIMISSHDETTGPPPDFSMKTPGNWENIPAEFTTLAQLRFRNITNERVINACFGKDTIIPVKQSPTTIDNVKVGDELENGDTITSVFKLDAVGHSVYNIKGINVSSNHKIWINNHKNEQNWVFARDYPNSKECVYNDPYLYCVNTTSKKLTLNNVEFADWDEIVPDDIIKIKASCKSILPKHFKHSHIHKYLDGGFAGDTLCTLINGTVVKLSDININDVLITGEKIKGLVEVDASLFKTLNLLKGKTCDIVCGPNIRYSENECRNMTTIDLDEKFLNKNKTRCLYSKLYHVITDTKTVTIDGIVCYDYDGCLDKIVEA